MSKPSAGAVEAMATAFPVNLQPRAKVGLDAAYPIIRADVIAEVAAWLRADPIAVSRLYADSIEREFGSDDTARRPVCECEVKDERDRLREALQVIASYEISNDEYGCQDADFMQDTASAALSPEMSPDYDPVQ